MLTTFSEGVYVARALADGTTGFLLKSGAAARARVATLTPREREVLGLVVAGL
jgi:FixJ family two-component response regulator